MAACKNTAKKEWSAQEIIDKSIEVAGGDLYQHSSIGFDFRDKTYLSEENGAVLKRIFESDSLRYMDIKRSNSFQRYVDNLEIELSDSLAIVYGNSVNSVHYFAQLPYRLNDAAVNKQLLKISTLKGKDYYVVQITFDKKNGGDDFDDTYVYWINTETFKPDYLAYEFHTDGGGVRFREAYNERYVNGIRFVDYKNYKPDDKAITVEQTAEAFENNQLVFLSDIQLENIRVILEN
tara:strand:- start:56584 stop:57288 length:705 start_codon:yes stop_codon:yes gene_type:complete